MSEALLTILQLLGAGFFGALIMFLFQWYKDVRTERLRRRSAYLQDQLRYLYGPVYFFMSQNQQLLDHSRNIMKQYEGHFEGKKWAHQARPTVRDEALATISLSNKYVQRITENNSVIVEILQTQWYLIDDDDIELFSSFQVHVVRHSVEFGHNLASNVPLEIRLNLGDVAFYAPDWGDRIKQKWSAKRKELSAFGRVGRSGTARPTAE